MGTGPYEDPLEEARRHVASGDLQAAVERVTELLKGRDRRLENEAILLASRLAEVRRQTVAGTLTLAEASARNAAIGESILLFLEEIPRRLGPTPAAASAPAAAPALAAASAPRPATTGAPSRPTVFISFSHRDKVWLERFQVFLKPLEREGLVERWDDTTIKTGERWKDEIDRALSTAKVAVFLVSADFLASDFIHREELPPLLAAEKRRGLVVMPVLLSPCRFSKSVLGEYEAANRDLKSVVEMTEAEQAAFWTRVADEIEAAVERAR